MGARFRKLSRPYPSCHLLSGEHEEGSTVETGKEGLIPCAPIPVPVLFPTAPRSLRENAMKWKMNRSGVYWVLFGVFLFCFVLFFKSQ